MKYSYEINPHPAELGGGWRLRLIEDGHETTKEALQAAFEDAEATAYGWLDSREQVEHDAAE